MLLPVVAYIGPLIIGLVVPFLVRFNQRLIKVIIISAITGGAFMVITGILSLTAGQPGFRLSILNWLYLGIFYLGYAIMVGGLSGLLVSIKIPEPVMQLIVGVLALLANTTVFYANPVIESVAYNHQARQRMIESAINLNPMMVIAANFFGHDILRAGKMYASSVIGPFYQYHYPAWGWVLAVYLVIGAGCLLISKRMVFSVNE